MSINLKFEGTAAYLIFMEFEFMIDPLGFQYIDQPPSQY